MKFFVIVFLLSIVASNAQNCMLPTVARIASNIQSLLQSSDDTNTANVSVSSFQYTCQAQGNRRDTYNQLSIIASYSNSRVGSQTRQFQLQCQSNQWDPRLSEGLETPPNNYQSLSTRTDCRQCTNAFGDDHHCRPCSSTCPGSGRCPGFNQCCSYFATDGTCTNNCTLSDGINYISGINSTNFTCSCNLTCDPGFIADDNCTQCVLNDICMADNPCQNGGTCTLLSSPDSYVCNCSTGTGYTGVNCTVCSLTCKNGYIPNDNCTQCILNDTCTADNPCQNGGTCILLSSPDSYTCNCTGTGYTGLNCTDAILITPTSLLPLTSLFLTLPSIIPSTLMSLTAVSSMSMMLPSTMTSSIMKSSTMASSIMKSSTLTSSTMTLQTLMPTPTQRRQGLQIDSLIGIVFSFCLGILLLLSLVAMIIYLMYYIILTQRDAAALNKAKSNSIFANSELHSNPLYLPPEEVSAM